MQILKFGPMDFLHHYEVFNLAWLGESGEQYLWAMSQESIILPYWAWLSKWILFLSKLEHPKEISLLTL